MHPNLIVLIHVFEETVEVCILYVHIILRMIKIRLVQMAYNCITWFVKKYIFLSITRYNFFTLSFS